MVPAALPQRGVLNVVPGPVLEANLKKQDAQRAAIADASASPDVSMTNLAAFIRTQYEIFSNHRNDSASGWSERMLSALRAFNGVYEPEKLRAIKEFGGSEIYARIVAAKCRGASSLLRDVYLAPDRPWGIEPPADPDVPPNITTSIQQLVQTELAGVDQFGGDPSLGPDAIRDRVMQLMEAARAAAKKRAEKQAQVAEEKIDELLTNGHFYKALADFLVDLPIFPFACIKGPVVRVVPTVSWDSGRPTIRQVPRLFWQRISPFDIWWTPGVSEIEDAAVIEKSRITRADLNDLLDLPGYDHDAVRRVLEEYGRGGLHDNWDTTDAERAVQENRENPLTNRSGMITCLEYHGNVQGLTLLEQGMDPSMIEDPMRDYMVQAWLIGRHIIKVQFSPSPRKRHPYFITSFEKMPGTPVGNGLPDILSDVQDVCNASLRTLINNLSIASGPQVVVNTDRLAPNEDGESLYPWKRWHVTSDPLGNNSQVPVSFFQPVSNAQELIGVFQKFSDIGDELSAIPKYLAGTGASGGAGRTAAGLAMLMSNASKILQTVAANIDRDVLDPALTGLFDMLLLTDTSGLLTGQEAVKVMGVNVAVQRETQRARQLEFLTATANPIDAKIVGPKGRAVVLRQVAQGIGIEGEAIVPSEQELEEMHQQEQMMQKQEMMAAAGADAQGGQRGRLVTKDMGPRSKIAGGVG
jgi:hypothetical protein